MSLELFKSLADPTRLRLLNILQQGEFTVQDLIQVLGMGQSRISRHLKILLDAGLLSVKREGTWAYYRLAPSTSLGRRLLPLLSPELGQIEMGATDRAAVVELLAARRERSQRFFDRHARDWDRLSDQLLPTPAYHEALLALLPAVNRLLEVGVGTGRLIEGLRGRSQSLVGIDQSPAMLNAARRRTESAALDHVDLRLGEMEHLPLEAASMDAAVLNMVLHHASDPPTVLAEIARVLLPGGVLVVADLARHRQEWTRVKMADQWLGFSEQELGQWAGQCGLELVAGELLAGEKSEFDVMLTRYKKTDPSSSFLDGDHCDEELNRE